MNLLRDTFKNQKQRWILPLYAVVYLLFFNYLECRSLPSGRFYTIHCPLDNLIPFCEVFVLPYLSWFLFMLVAFLYFIVINEDVGEYNHFTLYMVAGMTVFLVLSYLWPNRLALRPNPLPRTNFFTMLLKQLYARDTATNVFPSIHVYNSLSVYFACSRCVKIRKHPKLLRFIRIWAALIICSTVFVKQHSVYDVCAGLAMSYTFYRLIYRSSDAVDSAKSSSGNSCVS
uniref:phosphatase PAP2 family protein n=1 Tax=Eubacterium cellulosolvens TaxID=29322 RepID=UPI0006852DFF|nr:phosphatase PAP2 family protein [[Eubacterium] cellulosolvens]